MADDEKNPSPAGAEAAPASSRPDPPPNEPDKDLIGYVEKGQKPAPTPARPSEKR